ncbi:hypothetical protein K7X08_035017 [Anisodus acutangulus]|uniref:G-patch domain-containing protein n=1 Tax=Anisodus acutangulus TaxID=402998 RepID=A0A9Q1LI73_9SOLA|nr:hypothetical protein K7X08_035017 [Anisodus acutangulus]
MKEENDDLGLGTSSGIGFGTSSNNNADDEIEEEIYLPTAFGRKIKEGAEQRRKKEKEAFMLAKKVFRSGGEGPEMSEFGAFEKYTNGIARKLLKKMGYKGGGLGKNEHGIVVPIEAKLRPKKNMGMGFNDFKETRLSEARSLTNCPDQPVEGRGRKRKLWSKQVHRIKKVHITAEELLAKKEEEGFEVVHMVFDMRGPQVRILTNLENLNAEEKAAKDNYVPMPELQHNIGLIIDLVELDIQKIDNDLRNERETVVLFQMEKEKLKSHAVWQKEQLSNIEEIAREPERMLHFLELWEKLLPPAVLQTTLENIVLPKLSAAVNSWDPHRETIPVHSWLHPWLPLLGQKLENFYFTIRSRKIEDQEKAAAQAQGRPSVHMDGTGGALGRLKDIIETHAQQNHLLFKPKPGRMQDGHQIYGFGNISIIVDSLNQKVFAHIEDQWSLVSLDQLVDLQNQSDLKLR